MKKLKNYLKKYPEYNIQELPIKYSKFLNIVNYLRNNDIRSNLKKSNIIELKDNHIYLNGKIFTKYLKVFKTQKYRENNVLKRQVTNKFSGIDVTKFDFTHYIGKDRDDNIYWVVGFLGNRKIIVLNQYGDILDFFRYRESLKSYGYPAVHPSGDIYKMDFDEKHHYLYRIKRVW